MAPDVTKPKIVIICGPTGVGKTSFAIDLARRFNGQIVGADAMQIYRRMDIGTAKPTALEKAAVRHHMVDVAAPDQPFDAALYSKQAHMVIGQLVADGVVPFVVGGTGLYIKSLVYGLFQSRPSDPLVRQRFKEQLAAQGAAAMHRLLKSRDSQAAERIHPNDTFRVVRALEVIEVTGRPLSEHHRNHAFQQARYRALYIGLTRPRQALYDRINRRVDQMISEGLLEEVRDLLKKGIDPELKSMQSLGYRHMIDFIKGRLNWDEAVRDLKRDHRRYAKRQFTWFKAVPDIQWLTPDQSADAARMVSEFLCEP